MIQRRSRGCRSSASFTFIAAFSVALVGVPGCDDPARPPPPRELVTEEVVAGSILGFLTFLTAPVDDDRLFILEKEGRVRIVENGVLLATPFLDITGQLTIEDERGLLGLAFHPRYASNGYFFVNYTNLDGDVRVVRYRVSADRNVADPSSAKEIILIDRPAANHNGGMIAFGPDDLLYIGVGDSGGHGDPQASAQNREDVMGDLLRIDIDTDAPYGIPPTNPYAQSTTLRREIWASGLRNPWRFSFDRATDDLYIGDVGQDGWEEINSAPASLAGVNYGWDIMEARTCFAALTCDSEGLRPPVVDYPNDATTCSVTGGYVYRGSAIPGLRGYYLYSDFCASWLRGFVLRDGTATEAQEWSVGSIGGIASFGEDAAGELYLLTSTGRVFRIVAEDE